MQQLNLQSLFDQNKKSNSSDTNKDNRTNFRVKSTKSKSSKSDVREGHRIATKREINNAIQNLVSQFHGLTEYDRINLADSSEDNVVDIDSSMAELAQAHQEHKNITTSRINSFSGVSKQLFAPNWIDRTYSHIVRAKSTLTEQLSIEQLERSLEDFKRLSYLLNVLKPKPDIEIDESGMIGLYWDAPQSSFCLRLLGNGEVIGSYAGELDQPYWSAQTSNERFIFEKLVSVDLAAPVLSDALQ